MPRKGAATDGSELKLEAAELAGDDLDTQLVARLAHLSDWDLEVSGDLERLCTGQPLLVARPGAQHLDESWNVAR
jgi:hypothetical protein